MMTTCPITNIKKNAHLKPKKENCKNNGRPQKGKKNQAQNDQNVMLSLW